MLNNLEKRTFRVSVPKWGWDPEEYSGFSHEDALRTWYKMCELDGSFTDGNPQMLTVVVELDTIVRSFVVDTEYDPRMVIVEELGGEQETRESEGLPQSVARGPGTDSEAD
jgi:hypothetical protein